MKRCPKCSRTFPDDNQKFCTVDGGLLVMADQPFDPNATVHGSANLAVPVAPVPDKPVSSRPPDFGETIAASAPTVVLPKQTGPTGSVTGANLHQQQQHQPQAPPPPATAPPAPPPVQRAQSAPLPQAQSAPLPRAQSAPLPQAQSAPLPRAQSAPLPGVAGAPPKKKSKLPLILGILALLLVFGASALAAALYFLVLKPRREAVQPNRPIVEKSNQNENVNNNTSNNNNANNNTNTTETKPEVTEFVAPPDTTKFTNSQANLDGNLAEHYLDFSFYYPDNWVVDPKAGTAGSGNFAKVERRLPPDFTQENFAVRWYESKGTFASDLPNYPAQVEEFSASLAKAFPEYSKVSEGPTKINSLDAYEFRWTGVSRGTVKGDLQLWGRVVFVPTGVEGAKTGAILSMFTTSLAPELSSVDDVGDKGQASVILESFRFGKDR